MHAQSSGADPSNRACPAIQQASPVACGTRPPCCSTGWPRPTPATSYRAVLDKAKSGDVPAATLILARLWPPRKARVRFHLPEMRSAADLVMGLGCLAAAVAAGELAPEEAAALAAVLESQRRAIETIELERRIAALERTGTQR